MKILYTLNSSNYGGMEKTVLDLVKGLPGYVKYVVCPEGDYFKEFQEFSKVYKFRPVKKFDLEYIKFLRKIIFENDIKVVHSNEPKIVFNTLLACLFTNVEIRISHTHTPISMWQVPLISKLLNILFNSLIVNFLSTYEIALTESIKLQKIKEGILPFKLKVIPNSLDPVFIEQIDNYTENKEDKIFISRNFNKEKFSFLYLSRFSKEKNQILLINSFYEFVKKYPDSQLVLAGKGEGLDLIKRRIRDLNLGESVNVITEVSERNKICLYQNCDCFVFPSLAEGFGITLLEAMYSCYPVISSNLNVLKEVSNNKVMYFKSNNSKSLLSKMKEAFNLNKSKSKLKENKDFILEKYTIEKYINNYLNIYKI
jgi:glycosyltransferase involved in cell wall biosynthesis